MPYLPNAQSFLEQASLLISARPTTASLVDRDVPHARVTTKYNVPHPSPPPNRHKPSSLSTEKSSDNSNAAAEDSSKKRKRAKKARLTLKCYDPVSGTCLKYQTDKGAEVGRLVAVLGRCGRVMTGLPPKAEAEENGAMDVDGAEAGKPEKDGEIHETSKEQAKGGKPQSQGAGQGKGGDAGGGKKKKKGKR